MKKTRVEATKSQKILSTIGTAVRLAAVRGGDTIVVNGNNDQSKHKNGI